jgi:amino acid transporter
MTSPSPSPRVALSLWDVVSLLIGIVVGTAIFKSPSMVFRCVATPWEAFGLWLVGGLLSLGGAVCYAELAAAYPRSGGDYEYLGRAYGRWVGLQFAWAQLLVVLTGSVGSMACAFADYAGELWPHGPVGGTLWAVGAIAGLTLINLGGLVVGKRAQNLLTLAKLVGLGAIIACGLFTGDPAAWREHSPQDSRDIGLALVFILYAYAGWSHAAYIAAEVRDPQRNLPRALLVGVGGVTVLYLLVNLSYLMALGFSGVRAAAAPAALAMEAATGPWGSRIVAVLVMLSALGAINGTLLTGARVFAVLAEDYPRLSWLRRSPSGTGTPVRALLAEGAIAGLLVLAVGTEAGRQAIDRALLWLSLPPVPWSFYAGGSPSYSGGFETLVTATAPLYWLFCLLTGVSLFVLRWRDPFRPRPFLAVGTPVVPALFVLACLYMLQASLRWAGGLALLGVVPIVTGVIISGMHCGNRPSASDKSDSVTGG